MKIYVFLIALLHTLIIGAQPPEKFVVTFGGEGIDIGYGVKETFYRQYIIIGSTTSYGSGSSDAYLVLVDSMGNAVWQKTFGGFSQDVGKSIIVNPLDSGFIFTGFTSSFGNGGYDIYVVRTDKNGNKKWESSFGGLDWDFGNDLVISSDGNIIICGSSFSSGYGKRDGIVLNIDINNGNLKWQKKYGGDDDDDFQSIKKTSDNYYTLAGNTKSYGDINNDYWIFKVNNSGDSISSKHFGNLNKAEMCYDFIEDNNNDLVFCGSYDTSFYNTGKNISYAIKTNLNGNFISEVKIAGAFTPDDKFMAIANMASMNQYFFSRRVNHVGPYGIDVQPYLMTPNFIFLGTNTYGGTREDEAFDVISTKNNGCLMVGFTNGFNLVSQDVLLVKLDNTLFNAELLVGLSEKENHSIKDDIYYYNNVVYFKNTEGRTSNYELINSSGQIIESGSTHEQFIKLKQDLKNDIYILRIIEKKLKLKFIKNN